MKVPHGKIRRQAINYGVRHFAPTFSRKNPAIRSRLRVGFPFFSRNGYIYPLHVQGI